MHLDHGKTVAVVTLEIERGVQGFPKIALLFVKVQWRGIEVVTFGLGGCAREWFGSNLWAEARKHVWIRPESVVGKGIGSGRRV